MLTETGRVVAVEDDGVWVETIRQSTCGACAARKGCGHGLLNRYAEGRAGYIRVLPGATLQPEECRIDDQVMISLPESVILKGSATVYLVPLVTLLAGALGGMTALGTDVGGLLGAAAGLAAGLGLVRLHAWHHRDDESLQPTMVEIVTEPPQALRLS